MLFWACVSRISRRDHQAGAQGSQSMGGCGERSMLGGGGPTKLAGDGPWPGKFVALMGSVGLGRARS